MFDDRFKERYTSIPFATHRREYRHGTNAADIEVLSHIHREIELLAVYQGSMRYVVDMQEYELEEGDLVIAAPYTPHRATIYKDRDLKHYCICFDLELLHDAQVKQGLENGTVAITPVIRGGARYFPYLQAAFEAEEEKRPGWEWRVTGNLALLFGALREDGHLHTPEVVPARSVSYHIVNYIAQHYRQDITSADAAQELHLSNSYFCRIFKKNFGYCFQEYLSRYRVEKSKGLLQYTDRPIAEISAGVGFNSFSYYSKMFKEYTQLTPREYRQKER